MKIHFVGIGTALFIYEDNYGVACSNEQELLKKLSFVVVDRFLDLWVTTYKDKKLQMAVIYSYIYYEIRQRLQKIWGNNVMYFKVMRKAKYYL